MYRCNLGMLKDSVIGYFSCGVFLQTLCFHRNYGLICRIPGCNFLWRAARYHTCFPLNSSSVPGCYSPSDVNSQGMSPCSTSLMHSSAQDVTKFYLQRLTLHCVLWADITTDLGQEKEFSFFFLFLSLLLVLGFVFKSAFFLNVLTTFFNMLSQSVCLWMILLDYVTLKIMKQRSLGYFYQEDKITSEGNKL